MQIVILNLRITLQNKLWSFYKCIEIIGLGLLTPHRSEGIMLHNCKTPAITPGKRIFKAGSVWRCKVRGCEQLWIVQPLSNTLKILVWKRK